MPAEIADAYADLVDDSVVATIGTINASGSVHLTGVRTQRDGTDFWISTTTDSVKHKNLQARPDVTLIWYDPTNAYRYVSVRGRAVEFVAAAEPERVRIRITPDHVIAYG